METKKNVRSNTKEKILLASIPVIGSIIIAILSLNNFKCNESKNTATANEIEIKRVAVLKIKAGRVNDNVVYDRYQDLYPLLAEGIKPYITETIFDIETDSIKSVLGRFIKPIDTIHSKAFGNDNFFINNQYQRGINIITISFDQNEKVIGLTTKHVIK